jgi:hypothetical protein
MAMLLISLVLGLLAVTRLTKLLVDDRLMLSYRVWVRKKWGEDSLAAYFVDCPWCTSMWVGALVMPWTVLYPNRWVMSVTAIIASSLVAGLILDRE